MSRPHDAARRTRGSWTPRIAGISAAVLAACGGALVYALASPAGATRPAERLSSRVSAVQTVGIIGQAGAATGAAGTMRMLSAQGGTLLFVPIPPSVQPQGDPQWTVDTMADGTFVFIHAPTGRCLAAAGADNARLALRRCDLGPGQRWHDVSPAVSADGHQYAQYRNIAAGRCLATAAAGSSAVPEPPALAPCRTAAPPRQLISFYWGVSSAT